MVSRSLAVSRLDLMTLFLDWSISILHSASAPSSFINLESFLEHYIDLVKPISFLAVLSNLFLCQSCV